MSTWTTPITWTNGAVTASQMNGLRDNLAFLKGFADLITNSTTADTGTATQLRISRTLSTETAFDANVSGDTVGRLAVLASGAVQWSTGAATADTRITRNAAGELQFDTNGTGNTAALRVFSTSGQRSSVSIGVAGDTLARSALFGDGTLQGLEFGTGSSTRDVRFRRNGAAGDVMLDSNGVAADLTLRLQSSAGGRSGLAVSVANDVASRTVVYGDATMAGLEFGSGATTRDVNLYRSAANYLTSDDKLRPASFRAQLKAGTPVDGDVVGGAESGDMILDTTNSRIYFRVGTTWKSVVIA